MIGPIGPPSSEKKAADILSRSMGATMATSNIALASTSLTTAFRADFVSGQIVIRSALAGDPIVKPETVLRTVSAFARSFPLGNPFTDWAESDKCTADSHLERMEISSNFFGNFGEDLSIIAAIGILSLFISISTYLLLKRVSEKRKRTRKVLAWIGDNYGISFFFAKIESSHFEIQFFGLYNLVRSGRNTVMVVGDAISLILDS